MAIGPIELNGMVSRSQDVSLFKQNEDNKAMVDQSNILNNVQKKVQDQTKQVNSSEGTEYLEYRYDAKEKGNGSYRENKDRNKKQKSKEDGKVTIKQTSGFDMRI